jgi:hypothetical protein
LIFSRKLKFSISSEFMSPYEFYTRFNCNVSFIKLASTWKIIDWSLIMKLFSSCPSICHKKLYMQILFFKSESLKLCLLTIWRIAYLYSIFTGPFYEVLLFLLTLEYFISNFVRRTPFILKRGPGGSMS